MKKFRPRMFWRNHYDARVLEAFPKLAGNSVEPISRGERYFERMLAEIDGATRTVDVEMYLWDDDEVGLQFVTALLAAVARGVTVRVLVDAHGSAGIHRELTKVIDAGGLVRLFSPFRFKLLRRYFHRTHKKLLVVDGATAFIGGAGFSTRWSGGKRPERPWHDRMFCVTGPVVRQFAEVFAADLSRWDADALAVSVPLPSAKGVPSATAVVASVLRGWPDARDYSAELLRAVRGAKTRVWIGTPYFLPPRSLRSALSAAARRGVDVVVIHPSQNFAHPFLWQAVRARYGYWTRRGVRLFEYERCFYHGKLAVVDDDIAFIGSSNLDSLSWRFNAELDLALHDRSSVLAMASLFDEDLQSSRAVTVRDTGFRSGWQSLKATVAAAFENWM